MIMLIKILAVGCGGFFGCICRFTIINLMDKFYFMPKFPWGTMLANLLGCLIIGMLGCYLQSKHPDNPYLSALLLTGFLGGMTTFSSYSFESFMLMQDGYFFHALFNISAQVILGLAAAAVGFRFIQAIIGSSG